MGRKELGQQLDSRPKDGVLLKNGVEFRLTDSSMASSVAENSPRNVPSLQLYM